MTDTQVAIALSVAYSIAAQFLPEDRRAFVLFGTIMWTIVAFITVLT